MLPQRRLHFSSFCLGILVSIICHEFYSMIRLAKGDGLMNFSMWVQDLDNYHESSSSSSFNGSSSSINGSSKTATAGSTPAAATTRISFTVHPGQQTKVTHPKYICSSPGPNKKERIYSHQVLQNVTVAAKITTDLKIAMVGDSLGYLFFHALEEGMTEHDDNTAEHLVLYYTFRQIHEGLVLVSPTRGSGTLAFWRMTGMWVNRTINTPVPYAGKGWKAEHGDMLLTTPLVKNNNQTTDAFDAMIFRIPHGWIAGKHVTFQALQETVDLARQHLKVKCIIFVAMFYNNNVANAGAWEDLVSGNDRLRQFANSSSKDDFPILVLDTDVFLHEIIKLNAVELGMTNYSSWLEASFQERIPGKHALSMPQVCGKRPMTDAKEDCERNFVSLDGMHWCMETMGGRTTAGIACLLGCVFNTNNNNVTADRDCERQCNERYMNPRIAL